MPFNDCCGEVFTLLCAGIVNYFHQELSDEWERIMSNADDQAKILTSFLNLNFQTKIFFSLRKVFLHLFQNYSLSTTNNTANRKKKVARVISPNPY